MARALPVTAFAVVKADGTVVTQRGIPIVSYVGDLDEEVGKAPETETAANAPQARRLIPPDDGA